jgi:hypothetical protein
VARRAERGGNAVVRRGFPDVQIVREGGAPGAKAQLGYYRQGGVASTGIVYHTGFRMADDDASL